MTTTYIPCDVFDLYAECDDIVGVIKRKDPSGLEHRWYVDRCEAQGFLPQSILTPYRKPIDLLQIHQSMQNSSSKVILPSSDRSTPCYENIDVMTDHRYDTVTEEDFVSANSNHSSLLSFDDIDHPFTTNDAANDSLMDITAQFDPLAPQPDKNNESIMKSSQVKIKPNDLINRSTTLDSASIKRNSISDNIYYAAYSFKAGDKNQLSLNFGEKVIVKQKCDLQGNKEWWFVINSFDQKGYVPANYLRKGH